MNATTVYNKPKAFSWSYSKLKNFRTCPKRHYHCDIARDVVEEESEELKYGNFVHKTLADYIGKGVPIPSMHQRQLQAWADKLKNGPGDTLVEQKYAITEDFQPCDWRARDAWYRGIGDVVKLHGPVALVVDWKTGKIVEDSVQLALMAQCLFVHYPQLQKIRSSFVWLKEDAETRQDFVREDMAKLWASLLPEVKTLQRAAEAQNFPAKPGGLCRRYCPVKACAHHGE